MNQMDFELPPSLGVYGNEKIAKDIRDLKLKCKPTVEGDKLRISSASRDVLQQVIAALKQNDYGQPLQFVNYR